MGSDRRIRVMISSRCKDSVLLKGKTAELSQLRRAIKALVTAIKPFGEQLFDCWINEDSPALEGSRDSWDACLQQVRRADVLLVLYNGNPGWSAESGQIGICHAELQTGVASGAAKVFALELPEVELPSKPDDASRHKRFREYFRSQNLFVSRAKTADDVLKLIPEVLHEAVTELVSLGGREARKGRFDMGGALDWSRLDFEARKSAMETVVRGALLERSGSREESDAVYVRIAGSDILFLVHAIPSSVSNAAARELVGRPFHGDYRFANALPLRKSGPVHVIACHRGVTERQASDLLGQPDVATVDASFGVLAFDRASKVQCLFLRDCRDETTTRHAVQRAFDWLSRSGEDQLLAKRSGARARIVKAIAAENETSGA